MQSLVIPRLPLAAPSSPIADPAHDLIQSVEDELAELSAKMASVQDPSTIDYKLWISNLTSLCHRSVNGLKRSSNYSERPIEARSIESVMLGGAEPSEEGYDSAEEEADADIMAFLQTMQTPRTQPKPETKPVSPAPAGGLPTVPKLQLPSSNDSDLAMEQKQWQQTIQEKSRGDCLHCNQPVFVSQMRCKCVEGYLHQKCVDLIRKNSQAAGALDPVSPVGQPASPTGSNQAASPSQATGAPHEHQRRSLVLDAAQAQIREEVSVDEVRVGEVSPGCDSHVSPGAFEPTSASGRVPPTDPKMTIKLQLHELSKSVRIPVKFKLSKLCAKIVGEIPEDSDVAMQVERIVADGKQEQVGFFFGELLEQRLWEINILDDDIVYVKIKPK